MVAIPNLNIKKPVNQRALTDKYHLACTLTRNVKTGVTDCTYANSHGYMTRSMRTHLPPSPEGRDTLWVFPSVTLSLCSVFVICCFPTWHCLVFALSTCKLCLSFSSHPFSGVWMKAIRLPKTLTFDRMGKFRSRWISEEFSDTRNLLSRMNEMIK